MGENNMSHSFFSKYVFWLVLVLCLTSLGLILFMPLSSHEAKIIEKKKKGAELLEQKLIEIDNIEIVEMGYWKEDAITDYANLFKFEVKMLVHNHSDMEISLVRAKAKLVFRNYKQRAEGEEGIEYDIGTKLPPNTRKVCFTQLWAKYKHSNPYDIDVVPGKQKDRDRDLETMEQELLNNERKIILSSIYEIWADEPGFNPFSEIISFLNLGRNFIPKDTRITKRLSVLSK